MSGSDTHKQLDQQKDRQYQNNIEKIKLPIAEIRASEDQIQRVRIHRRVEEQRKKQKAYRLCQKLIRAQNEEPFRKNSGLLRRRFAEMSARGRIVQDKNTGKQNENDQQGKRRRAVPQHGIFLHHFIGNEAERDSLHQKPIHDHGAEDSEIFKAVRLPFFPDLRDSLSQGSFVHSIVSFLKIQWSRGQNQPIWIPPWESKRNVPFYKFRAGACRRSA